jgi:bifunctional non-homologous end joining protein LigD
VFKTRFSVQKHDQKKKRKAHLDIRILNRSGSDTWSWAIPEGRFPTQKERLLAIRTPNHPANYMYFSGTLSNGDKVTVFDRGECKILVHKHNLIIVYFRGKHIKGAYNLIRLHSGKDKNSWLITKSKKYG